MDCKKVGELIRQLRREQGFTQKNIADALNISNKTVSKWEQGFGCPDVSLLSELSDVLGADIQKMLEGSLKPNFPDSGNIKKIRFYVCPYCGNVLTSSGNASISCCGRKLNQLLPEKQSDSHNINIQKIDMEYYLSIEHEMSKSHYISFLAYVGDDIILLKRLYPEQSTDTYIPVIKGKGQLYGYCSRHGLWVQAV